MAHTHFKVVYQIYNNKYRRRKTSSGDIGTAVYDIGELKEPVHGEVQGVGKRQAGECPQEI